MESVIWRLIKIIFVCMCIIANPMRAITLGRARGRGVTTTLGRGHDRPDCPTPLSPQSGQDRPATPLLPPRQPFVRNTWMRRGFRRLPPSAAAPAATESAMTSAINAGLQLLLRRAANRLREVDGMLMRVLEILAEIDEQQQQKTDDE